MQNHQGVKRKHNQQNPMQQFLDVTTNLRKEKEAQVAYEDHEEARVSPTSIIRSIHDTDGSPLQRNLQDGIFLSP